MIIPRFFYPALLLLNLVIPLSQAATAPDLRLDVTLDPKTRQFKATAELESRETIFRFALHESLRISEARAGDKALAVERSGGQKGYPQWHIHIGKPNQKLTIRYEGILPALEKNRDHRSVLGGMPPMAAPAGSFLAAGAAWYPRPGPMFSYRVTLAVPHDQRALVAGQRTAETLPAKAGESYRATFDFIQPTDGIDLMAGPWIVREKTVPRPGQEPLHLRTFFTPELDAVPELVQGYLDDTQAYIARYSRDIGAYPYSEFSIVASPLPTGFGMPTLTYLGADVLRLPFIRNTSLGHEILHNWWGNGVYVDYEQGNWSEGLTTFMADYAYKEDESTVAAREMRLSWLRDAAVFADEKTGSLREFRARADAAGATVGYSKAAMFFVTLRDQLGKKTFDQGIRNFWATQRFRVANWDDLQAAFEQASGQRLGEFFSTWLDETTLPDIRIASAELTKAGKQQRLSLTFQKRNASLPLRLPIEVRAPGRQENLWVTLAPNSDRATLALPFAPQSLRLDPEMRVWRRLAANQLPPILRQWLAAKSPQVINVAAAGDTQAAVNQLAERFFEARPTRLTVSQLLAAATGISPVLIAGTHPEVDQTLAAAGLPPRPTQLKDKGHAQVWTVPGTTFPLAVISGRDAAAILALQRGLPHYGSQSWLVFEQGRAIDKGIWPARVPEIKVTRSKGT
ncbi:M1 family metallopeptidase [Dechloromonas sp.]|uniref:M1 family metallopeptidase n=1 Tax=Dechloromonas sp. TaxID=1917218 RepID=UPI00120E17F8|nr:M1 family aminopeptidase [Dechloromonas sp.]MBU3696996.1 M1 family metallopeptidase [Dechloromonas sp.]TEX49575.1 MAG: peptidase M1 [Rhodocyclaceae bacterium]